MTALGGGAGRQGREPVVGAGRDGARELLEVEVERGVRVGERLATAGGGAAAREAHPRGRTR